MARAQVRHDGAVIHAVTQAEAGDALPANLAFEWLLHHQGQSVDYALRYGGYEIVEVFGDGSEEALRYGGQGAGRRRRS